MTEALDNLIAAVEAGIWPGADMHDRLGSDRRGELAYDAFNGSLDSAAALKDALLPGWMMQIIETYDGETMVNLKQKCTQYTIDSTFAPSAARALLLATLRAVKGERDGSLNRPA